jgi:alkylation response protein AidB-like acyl-CoA dehydrogenase
MSTESATGLPLRGGAWLVEPTEPPDVFTPERLSEEQRLIGRTAEELVTNEIVPQLERLEDKDWALARRLVRRCADVGLLAIDVPGAYGGVALDRVSSLLVSEKMSRAESFGATFGGQANLTILPLVLFGTEAQKRKYLPRLVSGELIGAYCLSEAGSGSDALAAKSRAVRMGDGSFVLNGEKLWITNGGFADLFIVFAKEGGERFTAFIVERGFGGVSSGKEEQKMGLHGSSTTPVLLQDVNVPADNLLGEVGKGHKVAFNVLNMGRLKLGGTCVGGAKGAIAEASAYAAQRRQFGRPIASFGAIRHKIGDMVVRTYALESLVYRTGGLIDERIQRTPHDASDGAATAAALEEYAIEASIAKVAGSEVLDYVLDENIQIHGGNGFVRDYPAERHYRDARVNRIFEGTNEINRLLVPGMLARRAARGELSIAAVRAIEEESPDSPLAPERHSVNAFKQIAVMVVGTAADTYGERLSEQQEVLLYAADILIDVFSAESAVLRAMASLQAAGARDGLHADAARVFVNDAARRIEAAAGQALAAMVAGDTFQARLAEVRGLLPAPVDTVTPRRRLADEAVARAGYIF